MLSLVDLGVRAGLSPDALRSLRRSHLALGEPPACAALPTLHHQTLLQCWIQEDDAKDVHVMLKEVSECAAGQYVSAAARLVGQELFVNIVHTALQPGVSV